ncbi:rRNA-processing protein fcf2-like [Iris pallida]|uniref:rRNA-processing protein fcf2-like n=1 Tax=Iris pallida TaxID=29817 RepID=A0AAX6EVS3_IRIPA|nr:rRNA-processing protein fcf2-like [Iris pallida]
MENRSAIGLSWAPKVPFLSSVPKKSSNGAFGTQEVSLLKPENQLMDGLFVPPRDPKKLNKLLKKNVKDTSGPSWFEMPAPTITRELKKDLQILKMRNVIDPKRHFKKGQKSKELPKYFQANGHCD